MGRWVCLPLLPCWDGKGKLQKQLVCLFRNWLLCLMLSYGIVDAKPWWLMELGDLGTCSLSDTCKTWSTLCVDKFLPGKAGNLGCCCFWSEPKRDYGTSVLLLFRASRRSQSAARCKLIRSQTLSQQLGKSALKPLPGKNGGWVPLPVPAVLSLRE